MESRRKQEILYELAEQDAVYNVWKKSYEACVEPFRAYVDKQPEDIQNVLYGYAQCGRMMLQRIINIACENMEFIDSGKKS